MTWWRRILARREAAQVEDDVHRAEERRVELEARARRAEVTTRALTRAVEVLRHEFR